MKTVDPNWDHRQVELRSDHADAGLKGRDFALVGHLAFGKDEDAPALVREVAHIAERGQSARLVLGDGEGVEEKGRQIVVQAIGEAMPVKMLIKELFAH